jgi:hypothetical protein
MTVDLTGGLEEEREFVFGTQPDDPDMRESVNAWLWNDGAGTVGLPRVGVEAVGDQWETHDLQLNLTTNAGRNFNLFGSGAVHQPLGSDGKPRILGAGPLLFELVEPFRHWKMHFDGLATASTVEDQIAGRRGNDPGIPVLIDIDIRSVVPPWENGALLPEARRVLDEQDEGALMGGPRYEQLSRATGTVRVGDEDHSLDGGALRVRRQGIRRLGTFRGHAWQSAVFPSGRAFGYITYPPRADGLATYNEGYLFEGDGSLVPAWVVEAPWLRKLRPSGEDVSVILETAQGTTRIEGSSIMSNFMVMGGVGSSPDFPVLQQAITRYSWGGESAHGMMERSMPGDQITIP